MIASLEEVDAAIADQVDETVLLGEAARPGARGQVLQWFGLPEPSERISEHGPDQVEGPWRCVSVRGDPIPKILEELQLKHCLPLARCGWGATAFLRQGQVAL